INKFATACIDTSDGVYKALTTISELNNTGYEVSDLPYIKKGIMVTKLVSLPKTLLFLGECGEYELLFTIKPDDEEEFLYAAEKNNLKFYRLGAILSDNQKQILNEDNIDINLSTLKIQARDYDDVKDYLKAITGWIQERKEAHRCQIV
ncbi:thiamine-monophosphate kinase, partial [bacterium]|nr:thiamine-monophosphate kinase [bacterium]